MTGKTNKHENLQPELEECGLVCASTKITLTSTSYTDSLRKQNMMNGSNFFLMGLGNSRNCTYTTQFSPWEILVECQTEHMGWKLFFSTGFSGQQKWKPDYLKKNSWKNFLTTVDPLSINCWQCKSKYCQQKINQMPGQSLIWIRNDKPKMTDENIQQLQKLWHESMTDAVWSTIHFVPGLQRTCTVQLARSHYSIHGDVMTSALLYLILRVNMSNIPAATTAGNINIHIFSNITADTTTNTGRFSANKF